MSDRIHHIVVDDPQHPILVRHDKQSHPPEHPDDYLEIVMCSNQNNCNSTFANVFRDKKLWLKKAIFMSSAERLCVWERKEDAEIKPSFGQEVFYVHCAETNQKYVMKVIPYPMFNLFSDSNSDFLRELQVTKWASKMGIAPKLVQAFLTDGLGILVMEDGGDPFQTHVRNFLNQLLQTERKGEDIREIIRVHAFDLATQFVSHVTKLHTKYCHEDLFPRNVVVDGQNQLRFIDFGEVVQTKDKKSCRFDLLDMISSLPFATIPESFASTPRNMFMYFGHVFVEVLHKKYDDHYKPGWCIFL